MSESKLSMVQRKSFWIYFTVFVILVALGRFGQI